MSYPALQFRPGTDGTTLPNGAATVYSLQVANAGKFRIGADVFQGNAPIALELHLFTYPATSFIGKNSLIEAQLPTGTHYVAVRSVPGGVQHKIWKWRVVKPVRCPPGCVAVRKATGAARALAALRARLASSAPDRGARPGSARPRAGNAGPAPPRPYSILPDGPAVPVGLGPRLRTATFSARILAAGDYEYTVAPPPRRDQELFFLSLLARDGTPVQASRDGRLSLHLTPGTWTVLFAVPAQFLHVPRRFSVRLASRTPPVLRPDLDNPPDGDGQVIVDVDTTVDIAHTRPRAQLRFEVPAPGRYRVTCTEVTTGVGPGGAPPAPATLSFHAADGAARAGSSGPGAALADDLTTGRWWVDVAVPDFLGRTTPRRYSFRCTVVPGSS
jgi:hypothetical protein